MGPCSSGDDWTPARSWGVVNESFVLLCLCTWIWFPLLICLYLNPRFFWVLPFPFILWSHWWRMSECLPGTWLLAEVKPQHQTKPRTNKPNQQNYSPLNNFFYYVVKYVRKEKSNSVEIKGEKNCFPLQIVFLLLWVCCFLQNISPNFHHKELIQNRFPMENMQL